MVSSEAWYQIKNIESIDSPTLVVYPDRIKANIKMMLQILDGDATRLRPHVKTYKMAEVVQMQMEQGISKFKCATIAEAEMLGDLGAKDILLAYQPVGPKVGRLMQLIQRFPDLKFSALVDHPDGLKGLNTAAEKAGTTIDLYLDLDVGMHRTGIEPGLGAFELWQLGQTLNGTNIVGLHIYDGHLRDSDFNERKRWSDEGFRKAQKLLERIELTTEEPIRIVAGGTPTFPAHALRPNVECSPGTSLLWDWGYDQLFPDLEFQFGALVVCRVISKPTPDTICVDLGHKAIAAEQPFPRVQFLNLPDVRHVSQSEEHLVLELPVNKSLEIGDILYGVPQHICPTCALYDKAKVVIDNQSNSDWKIVSRNRKLTI